MCPSLEHSFGRLHGPLASKMLVATHLFSASRLKISLIEAVKILIKQQLKIQDFCLSTKEDPRRASSVYVVQDKVSGSGLSEVAPHCSAEDGTRVSYKDGACADKTFA